MENEVRRFLEAEEYAQKLVDSLKKLGNEISSYQKAINELDIVRKRIIEWIESTEKLSRNSHEIIKVLKDIGTPEIFHRIGIVENLVNNGFQSNIKGIEILKEEILENIKGLENKTNDKFVQQSTSFEILKKLMIMTLTSSILAIIIGVISILI